MTDHEHRFDLVLNAAGRGQIYGEFEGYVRRCKCGTYAPDYREWRQRQEVGLAAELYTRVVNPDLTWWDDLPPEMQAGWLRAARWLLDTPRSAWATRPRKENQ